MWPTSWSFSTLRKRKSKAEHGLEISMHDRQELGGGLGSEGGVSRWGYFEKQLCVCVLKGMTVEPEEEQTSSRVALVRVKARSDLLKPCHSLVYSKGAFGGFGVKNTGTD